MTFKFSVLALGLLAFSGCTKANPVCLDFPDTPGCGVDAGVDAPPVCTSNTDCSAPTGVCDVAGNACVECLPDQLAACSGATPACSDSHMCEACDAHTDCPVSNVCLEDGTCAPDPNEVAYVAPGGTSLTCTKADRCGTLDKALLTGRAMIKMATGIVKDAKTTVIDGRTVTIYADPGAELSRTDAGQILEIRSANANVQILDLRITGGTSPNGDAILVVPNGGAPRVTLTRVKIDNNSGNAISSAGTFGFGTTVVVSHSTIVNNATGITTTGPITLAVFDSTIGDHTAAGIYVSSSNSLATVSISRSHIYDNLYGGIHLQGSSMIAFDVIGNIIYGNGSMNNDGGVVISASQAPGSRLEFNTIVRNGTASGRGCGIQCNVDVGFTARNNIVYDNATPNNTLQIGGSCLHAFSDIGPDYVVSGSNMNTPPLFVEPSMNNWHITARSPVKGLADPTSELSGLAGMDIDGEPRTMPADIGADEIP